MKRMLCVVMGSAVLLCSLLACNESSQVSTITKEGTDVTTAGPEGTAKSMTCPSGGETVEVSWDKAIEILNNCEIKSVSQGHDLVVFIGLKDGTAVETVEPKIDVIFDEIAKCGENCRGIMTGTE